MIYFKSSSLDFVFFWFFGGSSNVINLPRRRRAPAPGLLDPAADGMRTGGVTLMDAVFDADSLASTGRAVPIPAPLGSRLGRICPLPIQQNIGKAFFFIGSMHNMLLFIKTLIVRAPGAATWWDPAPYPPASPNTSSRWGAVQARPWGLESTPV